MSKIVIPDFMTLHKELVGVCIGACVITKKWETRGRRLKDKDGKFIKNADGLYIREPIASAHAHTHPNDPFKGFICFRTIKDFKKETTCKHELAHIITGEGHTKKWAEKYVELKTPKWLTVEWLQKKYGFDNESP